MIESIDTDERAATPYGHEIATKVNELIEASNRQDRILANLIRNIPGGMEQYLMPEDYEETLKSYYGD